jgi:crotonobetainyl-CoA:carnitine CoA-transferase CaiB-like acyl-CoA transferase
VLGDVRVIDLSIARAGPAAVRHLADWGASVIRVEMPGGEAGAVGDHNSSDYINLHCNKRLVTIDLKTPEGHAVFLRLLDHADVLVENFRAPVKHRLGVGYHDLRERFPRLVYGSISGYGQDGPDAEKGAVDQIIQGISGLMSITGTAESGPLRAGIAVADLAAGALLANGILLALMDRWRSGLGQWVQVSLLESLLSFLDFQAIRWLADDDLPKGAGNAHPTIAPMGTFRAADGHLNIAAPNDRLWRRMCDVLGSPQLCDQPEYLTVELRHQNEAELSRRIQAILGTRPRAAWVDAFDEAGVPCGAVSSVAEAFADPQVQHLEMVVPLLHPARGPTTVLRNAITMSRNKPAEKTSSPVAGQHTDEILNELGYSEREIRALRRRGVV